MTLVAALLVASLSCDEDGANPPPPPGADTSPPRGIDDLALTFDSVTTSVTFAWTAQRDDDIRDRADRYDIRYSGSFPFDWELATRIADPPAPLRGGTRQALQLADPRRGRDVFASIRAFDAAGNESAAGSVAHVRVPGFSFIATCTDPLTGLPLAGLDALISGRRVDRLTSGPDGRIVLLDLAGGPLDVHLTSGAAATSYHPFDDAITLDEDVLVMYEMIPFQPPDSPLYPSILALLRTANFSPGGQNIIKRWRTYPVPWYARDFVNVNGLDYRALATQAAERWNTRVGFELFAPAASDPAVGVLIEFLPRSVMGSISGITEYTSDAEGYPLHDRVRIVDDLGDGQRLYAILMHELGHTIRLNHLQAGFIMYSSQPLPSDITDDEVKVVRLMLALTNGTSLDKYDSSPPAP